MPKSKSLPLLLANLLFFKEWLKQFAPVALYKRATVSDSLRLLMTKEWWEQFAQVAHDKRATGAICESLFRSFAHKKRVNRLKNRWANSQPWFYTGNFFKKLSFDTMREFVYTVRKEMKCSRDSGIQQEKVCENRKSMKYCNSCSMTNYTCGTLLAMRMLAKAKARLLTWTSRSTSITKPNSLTSQQQKYLIIKVWNSCLTHCRKSEVGYFRIFLKINLPRIHEKASFL